MFCKNILRFSVNNSKLFSSESVGTVTTKSKKTLQPFPGVTVENHYELLNDVVTPWWKVDYHEQVLMKKQWSREVVKKLKLFGLPKFKTKIHDVIQSPATECYRNKDEFSIRTGIDGNDKTVGFYIGSPAHGNVICVPPTKLISLKQEHVYLSQVFQELIRSSPLKASHNLDDGGFWRNLVVRSNSKGEIMAIVIVNKRAGTPEALNETKRLMETFFLNTNCNITSLYLQSCPNVKCTNDIAPYDLIYGDKYLYEHFDDLKVRLSPDSFIQVNTGAALLLYKAALDFLDVNERHTILDLCCGIGTFSILASQSVRGCVGLECISQAVEDAIFNAENNGIKNCHFITGRIEHKLKALLFELNYSNDIAPVVNPGRAGINKKATKLLRSMKSIRRLVYISCSAENIGAMKNFVDLCSTDFDSSQPFRLTNVQAVDMFPQTNHCELILLFER